MRRGTTDPRVDAYITRSAEFARPILTRLRETVHAACPDAEETMKWSFPFFMYKGMLCYMASFKEHCAFGFRRGSLVTEETTASSDAMGQFGRITRLADLPARRTLVGYIRKAAALNEAGVQRPAKPKRVTTKEVAAPADLLAALKRNARARRTFEAFSPSHRREYIAWIVGAKREETRKRRVATAVEWMAAGKPQNWRYLK